MFIALTMIAEICAGLNKGSSVLAPRGAPKHPLIFDASRRKAGPPCAGQVRVLEFQHPG